MRQVSRIAWGDAPRRHGLAMPPYSEAAGATRGMRQATTRPVRRYIRHTAGRRFARPSDSRGARRDGFRVPDRGRRCRGERGGGGDRGGILGHPVEKAVPRRHRRRTRGRRPPSGTTRRGSPQATAKATASQGFTQQCGSEPSSSRDGGSPSNTNRLTPARPADAAPGAAASFQFPPKKMPQAQTAPLRRTAFRAVSRLPNCSTRGR